MMFYSQFQAAMEKMKTALFRPFNLVTWFFMAFPAWVANLYEFGTGFEMFPSPKKISSVVESPQDTLVHFWDILRMNPGKNLLILLTGIAVLVVISIFILWLKARGLFVFMDIIDGSLDSRRFEDRRNVTKERANIFFRFRLIYKIIAYGIPGLISVVCGFEFFVSAQDAMTGLRQVLVLSFAVSLLWFFVRLIDLLYVDFGSYLIFHQPETSGYGAFCSVMKMIHRNFGSILGYLIALFLINLIFALGLVLLLCMTCCLCFVGGLFLMTPYFWAVLLLPYLYFRRAFAMECADFFRNELAFTK